MTDRKFQFTLAGLMLAVAAAAAACRILGYWLDNPWLSPVLCIALPLVLAVLIVARHVSDTVSNATESFADWQSRLRRYGRMAGPLEPSHEIPSPRPVTPLESFQRYDAAPAAAGDAYAPAEEPASPPRADPVNAPSSNRSPHMLATLRIDAVEVTIVNLPCKATFHLAGGDFSQQGQPTPRAVVKVVGSNGVIGWGEVTPCPTWCYETSESITSTIRRYLAPALVGMHAWDLDAVCRKMERVINPGATIGQPLAKSGIDIAIHDMLARSLDVPLYVLLGGRRLDKIQLSYIVSASGADEAAAQTRRGLELGYQAFKIKVGMHGEEQDFRIVAAVHDAAPKGTFLWVDANQGYGLDNAIRQARRMATLGVAAFEQPLKGSRPSEFRRLVELGAVPIAIDESLCSPTDLMEYIKAGAVDLPVAKVQRCGGLWWSRQFCQIAEAAGLRLMGSGLCETDLGLATGVHLFAAFGIDLPCDLNGRQFVESAHLSRGARIDNGWVTVPDTPGIGVEVDESLVRRFADPAFD